LFHRMRAKALYLLEGIMDKDEMVIVMDETTRPEKGKPGAKRKDNAKVPVCFKVSPEIRDFLSGITASGRTQAAIVDLGLELAKLYVEMGQNPQEGTVDTERFNRSLLIKNTLIGEGEKMAAVG
jgi:hypothetical protein